MYTLRAIAGAIYLLTGLVGLFEFLQLTLLGMYGVPGSRLYLSIAVGSVILILGSILTWASKKMWVKWLPLIGSLALCTYFLPAIVVTFHRYATGQINGGSGLIFRTAVVVLVIISLWVSVKDMFGKFRSAKERERT